MSQEIVYDDSDIQVIYRQGSKPYLTITFSPLHAKADGNWFWGKPVADVFDLSVLAFVARASNWYPTLNIERALPSVRDIIARHDFAFTYGQSMGAHAALKHSRRLRANRALAFSPQDSIDPRIMGEDYLFSQYHVRARDTDVTLTAADICGDAIVFYDPYDPSDAFSINKITQLSTAIRTVPVPSTGHKTIRLFLSRQTAGSFLDKATSPDRVNWLAYTSRLRRSSHTRTAALLGRCIPSRPGLASRILSAYRGRLGASEAETMLENAQLAQRCGAMATAEQLLVWLVERPSPGLAAFEELIKLRTSQNDVQGALYWSERALKSGFDGQDMLERYLQLAASGPHWQHLDNMISHFIATARTAMLLRAARLWVLPLISRGRLQTAETLLTVALEHSPDDQMTLRAFCFLRMRQKRPEEAVNLAERAVALSARAPHVLGTLASAYLAAGRREEAVATLEEAIQKAPQDPKLAEELRHARYPGVSAVAGEAHRSVAENSLLGSAIG